MPQAPHASLRLRLLRQTDLLHSALNELAHEARCVRVSLADALDGASNGVDDPVVCARVVAFRRRGAGPEAATERDGGADEGCQSSSD